VPVNIHPQSIVEPSAQLGENVEVGPFCFIGGQSIIGDNCRVLHHATVEGKVTLGRDNTIFPYALIGGLTHDLKYEGGQPGLTIGDGNVFREYVTAHVATKSDDFTTIGSNNVFLAYSHVAHDCQIGDHLVMSSHSALGGHVEVGNHVNVGWGAGVHQFCRLGRHCMVSACSKLVQDVPPFMLADGSPAEVRSINKVGLERANFNSSEIELIRSAFKILYRKDLNRSQALKYLEENFSIEKESVLEELLSFTKSSARGMA
jgi:UDP-N-acetylglucosamine acyltransferase